MRTSEANPADWYLLAEDRLTAADAVLAGSDVTYTGIELLHEAVERYPKGYLVSHGWTLRRTHDLGELLADATTYDARFAAFQQLADNLTDQFWHSTTREATLPELARTTPRYVRKSESWSN